MVLGLILVGGMVLFIFTSSGESTTDGEVRGAQSRLSDSRLENYMPVQSRVPPPQYRHYWNEDIGVSLFYPETMIIDEHPERNGGMTVVFTDEASESGFQIYVATYFEDTISEEQFKLDVPSGVRNNAVPSTIDYTESVEFKSEDEVLGPTFEVWVIKNGYLYEVTAPLDQRELVRQVVTDWRFY